MDKKPSEYIDNFLTFLREAWSEHYKTCDTQTVYAIKQYQKDREKNSPGSVGAIDGIAGPKTLQDMIAL